MATSDTAGYVQVYLEVPLAVAAERNSTREAHERVPDSVMHSMVELLHPPDAKHCHWERNSVLVDATAPRCAAKPCH